MRITGGVWRSRRLRGPGRGQALRPTPDALRERGFAVLRDLVAEARFLDLYAGTGAVGLEALSRGAREVVFVERHRPAARIIEANCAALEVTAPRWRLLVRPALRAVAELGRRGESFDLAWADPPFEHWHEGLEALERAFELGVLKASATACLECPSQADVGETCVSLRIERDLVGGASRLVLLGIPDDVRTAKT